MTNSSKDNEAHRNKKPKQIKPRSIFEIVVDKLKCIAVALCLVAVFFLICLGPTIFRTGLTNDNAAMATVKNFSTAAVDYFESNPVDKTHHYWADGTTDFGIYFSHVSPKSGYNFYYFSNSKSNTEATKYLYTAFPVSRETGKVAYVNDETGRLYLCELDEETYEQLLKNFTQDCSMINWNGSWSENLGYTRFGNSSDWQKR